MSTQSYSGYEAYGYSKLANVLFTYELNKRLTAAGNPRNIKSIVCHPGFTATK